MAGQRNHFRNYAPGIIPDQRQVAYGAIRYTNEVERLYGVLDKQLEGQDYRRRRTIRIADMIIWPWVNPREQFQPGGRGVSQSQAWHARVAERPAVKRALEAAGPAVQSSLRSASPEADKARAVLFGQRARK